MRFMYNCCRNAQILRLLQQKQGLLQQKRRLLEFVRLADCGVTVCYPIAIYQLKLVIQSELSQKRPPKKKYSDISEPIKKSYSAVSTTLKSNYQRVRRKCPTNTDKCPVLCFNPQI